MMDTVEKNLETKHPLRESSIQIKPAPSPHWVYAFQVSICPGAPASADKAWDGPGRTAGHRRPRAAAQMCGRLQEMGGGGHACLILRRKV